MSKRFQYAVVTGSTGLLVMLALGILLGRGNAAEGAYKHFAVFTEVISRIKSDYVEEPDMRNVTLGALNGMLESVDSYASYLSADQYKQYLKSVEEKKGGPGLLLSRRFGYITVVDAIPGSPAAKAGLTTGDVIETLAGVSTRDMPLAYAQVLMAGDPGTNVEMAVLRVRRGAEAQKMSVPRAATQYPAVTMKMANADVAHIEVPSLDPGKARDVAAKVREAEQQGAKRLVLDLRFSGGGAPEEGLALANLFLDKGRMSYLEGQKVARKDFEAEASKQITKLPLVVITNRGTAGAAEVAATALLDNKRAEVVGERTYGDAAMRKALTLEDGSAVILSVAKYFNAAGKAIQDNGVTPSLAVAGPEPDTDDDDDDAPKPNQPAPPKSNEDKQLQKAIEVVTNGLAAAKKAQARSETAGQPAPGPSPVTPVGPLGVPRK